VTKIADDDHLKSRERAVALQQGGKLSEAAEIYEILLRAEPANPDLWGLLSIAQLWLGRDEEALASWRKCLSIEATVPLRLRNIANFVLAMQQKNKIKAQSMDFLEGLDIPDWPKDLPLDRNNQSIIVALSRCLTDLGRKEAALRLLDSILAGLSGDPDFLATVAPIMVAAGKPEKMLELLRALTSSDYRGNGTLLIPHAAAAGAAQRREEAKNMSLRAREAVPVFLSAKMPNQRLLIGVHQRRLFSGRAAFHPQYAGHSIKENEWRISLPFDRSTGGIGERSPGCSAATAAHHQQLGKPRDSRQGRHA